MSAEPAYETFIIMTAIYISVFLCMFKSLFPLMAPGTVSIGFRFCVDSRCTKTVAPHETETNVPWTWVFFVVFWVFLKVCPVWLTNRANSHEAIKALCILCHLRLNKESQHCFFCFFGRSTVALPMERASQLAVGTLSQGLTVGQLLQPTPTHERNGNAPW